MFLEWLKPKKINKETNQTKKMRHAILNNFINTQLNPGQEEILFACGCFWGAEKCFWKLPGVFSTAVGFAGGHKNNPTYNQVCSGKTGHTEVVRVVWDTSLIDVSDLLKMFWECHDPTQGNRQGNDRGTQYRSAIFTSKPEHLTLALKSKDAYEKLLGEKGFSTITTQIEGEKTFYIAEDYHQQYLAKPGSRPYCSAMPTKISLKDFPGSNFKLPPEIWSHFDWSVAHCVLRSDNSPIPVNN